MIQAPGIGSNLDVNGIVNQLMTVERQPLQTLQERTRAFQTKLSAYGSLKSALATFQDTLKTLSNLSKFSVSKASLADAGIASVNASGVATPGTYTLEVERLAQQHKLYSTAAATSSAVLGNGSLTIEFGTYDTSNNSFALNADKPAQNVTIAPEQNTLAGARDAINAASIGVSANIVTDNTGARLILTSNDSGAANSIRISATDADGNNSDASGLSQLAYDPSGAVGTGKNLTQSAAAQDARFAIDGLWLSKSSNNFSDVVEGLTITLQKTNLGNASTLTVERDKAKVQEAIEAFVKGYNDINKTLRDLTAYDEATRSGAALQGDSTVRGLQGKLRSIIAQPLSSLGSINSLSKIGITLQRDGSLTLDADKLNSALQTNFSAIAPLFASDSSPEKGYARQLHNMVEQFLGANGSLATRTNGINNSLRDIQRRVDAFNLRMDQVEKRYRAQFTALDRVVSALQTTSNFLTQQLNSLSSIQNN